ncbi:G5 domain-containing protein [Actinoplanes sp. NPDC048791]|uniref:G5 domain-containing protein n=1 Tax=Actinoplanes sp. NPDC048791 TaxID=3154623 RepID=UPI0033C47CA1
MVQKRTVQETQKIAFKTRKVKDSSLPEGTTETRVRGVAGVRTLTYEVTVTDGVQSGKRLIKSVVTKKPVTKVTAIGTRSEPDCDPNYSGGCVPVDSDVDCAGGIGNGPSYVDEVVKVIGTDIYDLDRDNDGFGCD